LPSPRDPQALTRAVAKHRQVSPTSLPASIPTPSPFQSPHGPDSDLHSEQNYRVTTCSPTKRCSVIRRRNILVTASKTHARRRAAACPRPSRPAPSPSPDSQLRLQPQHTTPRPIIPRNADITESISLTPDRPNHQTHRSSGDRRRSTRRPDVLVPTRPTTSPARRLPTCSSTRTNDRTLSAWVTCVNDSGRLPTPASNSSAGTSRLTEKERSYWTMGEGATFPASSNAPVVYTSVLYPDRATSLANTPPQIDSSPAIRPAHR